MTKTLTIEELKANHPMPWKHVIGTNGQVVVLDSRGAIVNLFTILALVERVTQSLAQPDSKQPSQASA